jgi:hypothetical protein
LAENFARATAAPRRLVLGGEVVYAEKLTPRALGILQAFLIERLENPYAAAREAIAELADDDARRHWVNAFAEAQAAWPPDIHTEAGIDLLATPEGRGVLVWASCQRHTQRLTRDRADAIGEALSPDEFFDLFEWMAPGEVGDLRNPDAKGGSQSYAELRCKLCEKYPGWTFETVDNMTFEQIGQACNDGKRFEVVVEEEADLAQSRARWREYYVGL